MKNQNQDQDSFGIFTMRLLFFIVGLAVGILLMMSLVTEKPL